MFLFSMGIVNKMRQVSIMIFYSLHKINLRLGSQLPLLVGSDIWCGQSTMFEFCSKLRFQYKGWHSLGFIN